MAFGVYGWIFPPAAHLSHLLIETGGRGQQRGLGLLAVAAVEVPAQAIGNVAALADKRPHPFVELITEHRAKQFDTGVFGLHRLSIGAKALVIPCRAENRISDTFGVEI